MIKSNSYSNRLITKPWGYEYIIFKNQKKLALIFLKIFKKKQTSLHCHPNKKTGFIILSGTAKVQIGIYKKNSRIYKSQSILVFRPGLFHSLKCISNKPLIALEIETPFNTKDLIRFSDNYGRQLKPYENLSLTKKINSKFIKFKKPQKNSGYSYKLDNMLIEIRNDKNYKNLFKKNEKSISAILDGSIISNDNKKVITHGEIVKTKTLEKLSKKFKIKKDLTVLKVTKIKDTNKKYKELHYV
tara:strand:+ start:63 stop:791 length:729 start_codon:yes stop_codon:yes gene_type:complete